MPRIWKLSAPAVALWGTFALAGAVWATAAAQEEAGDAVPAEPVEAVADTTQADQPAPPTRRKHPDLLGVRLRGQYRIPIKVLKVDVRDLNDILASGSGLEAGLSWWLLDGMALSLHYSRGGLNMTDKEQDLARFPVAPGVQGDEYLQLDAYTFAIRAYLGGKLFPKSSFNPYFVGTVSRYDWVFAQSGRDSEPYYILDVKVEGRDTGVGAGIGTECRLGGNLLAEAEWTWNYVLTELDENSEAFEIWTNTHYWQLAGGLTWTF